MSSLNTEEKTETAIANKKHDEDEQGQIPTNLAVVESQEANSINQQVSSIGEMDQNDAKRCRIENNNDVESALVKDVTELNISNETKTTQAPSVGTVIVNKENTSLKSLLVYHSDESSSSSSSDDDDDDEEDDWQLNAEHSSSSSKLSSESGLSYDENDDDDDTDIEIELIENRGAIKKQPKKPIKCPGELLLEDLPPVPDPNKMDIKIENSEFLHIGEVVAIMTSIVTVEALPNIPAFDLDTVLFFGDDRKPLGHVYDVFGPVTSPIYAVRFNSSNEIESLGVKKGMKVYTAPKSEYTHYVFLMELLKMKGSDASWVGDTEMPSDVQDYSDDELEGYIRSGRKSVIKPGSKRCRNSLERYKQYERTMNQCNTLNSRFQKLMDSQRHSSNVIAETPGLPTPLQPPPLQLQQPLPILFDPRIPPPNMRMPSLPHGVGPGNWT